ncbi:carboxymuconolactone decarboxylase family protein [Streptomyces sp. NPDC052042]|uniref:carboxymuconolactone decarboxylase family protein n=1 Tax=Streptomyces sp. NPDC052042 TaxID=3365683 RepID=UPI0037D18664
MTRSVLFDPEHLADERRALYDELRSGPRADPDRPGGPVDSRGRLTGPFNAMLHSPRVGGPLQRLGAALRYESSIDDRVREMAILLVAGRHDCAVERITHQRIARDIGISEETIGTLERGEVPASFDDGTHVTAAAALELAERMLDREPPDDAGFERLQKVLGPDGVFEVSSLVGYYWTLAHQLNLFAVEPIEDRSEA